MNHIFRFVTLSLFAISLSVKAQDGSVKTFGFLQPNYIITGIGAITNKFHQDISKNDKVKFRISLYFRLIGMDSSRTGLYFGYT